MDKMKKSINVIVEVLLVLSIILAVLSIFLKLVVLNKNTYTNILDQDNTYKQVEELVYNKIDAVLSAKNINYDIKESIITEDDIRNEADNVISGFAEYLKTGKNNIKPIDSQVYKQRTSDVLHSTIGKIIKSDNGEVSFNDAFEVQKTAYFNEGKLLVNKMTVVNSNSQNGQDALKIQKLMTRDEAEAKVRELLKQKGLTVDQAIKKAQEKGITEEQALKILAGYGITIDDETKGGESAPENSSSEQTNTKNNSEMNNEDKASSGNEDASAYNKTGGATGQASSEESVKNQLNKIENKLLDEAGKNIEDEVNKVDFNKIADSNKFQKLAKITSTIYKVFWLIMLLPIVFIVILIKINDIDYGLRHTRNVLLYSGLTLFVVFFGLYSSKVYEKININSAYSTCFNQASFDVVKYFLINLAMYGFIVFAVGLLLFIPTGIKLYKKNEDEIVLQSN